MSEKKKQYVQVEAVGVNNEAGELKHVGGDGIPLCKVRIGVKLSRKERGEWKSSYVNYQIEGWHEMAETLARVPAKSLIKVIGRLKVEEWTDKRTGEMRTSQVIAADSIEIVGSVAPRGARDDGGDGSAFGGGGFSAEAPLNADDLPF